MAKIQEVTGNLQKKCDKWYLVIGYYDIDGKRKQKWISTGLSIRGNKKNAEKMLKEELEKYNSRGGIRPNNLLFSDYLRMWVKENADKLESTTLCNYQSAIENHLYPYFKEKQIKLQDLHEIDIKQYYQDKRDGYQCRNNKPLGKTSLVKHHAIIHRALVCAKKDRLISYNPAENVDRPKIPCNNLSYYTLDEIYNLLSLIKEKCPKLYIPAILGTYYGLRRSEICGLKWDAIDFKRKTITIRHVVTAVYAYDENTGTWGTKQIKKDRTKTKSSFRTMPMLDKVESLLMEERKRQMTMCTYFKDRYANDDNYVCVHEDGSLITPDYITHTFGKFISKEKLRHIRFHDLRHSCASLLLNLGFSMSQIQDWLGHESYNTTAKYYAHLDPNSKRAIGESLNQVINDDVI